MQERDLPAGDDSLDEGEGRRVNFPKHHIDCAGLSQHWQLAKSVSVEQLGLSFSLARNRHTSPQWAEVHVKNGHTGEIQSEEKNTKLSLLPAGKNIDDPPAKKRPKPLHFSPFPRIIPIVCQGTQPHFLYLNCPPFIPSWSSTVPSSQCPPFQVTNGRKFTRKIEPTSATETGLTGAWVRQFAHILQKKATLFLCRCCCQGDSPGTHFACVNSAV